MKNVRRLIPVVALLLVTAVMLSTASFAWFTMNDRVTATGMEIQAKASGNLIINNVPMTSADKAIEVTAMNFAMNAAGTAKEANPNGGKINLTPITYDNGWKVPADGAEVDPMYGGIVSTDKTTTGYSAGSNPDSYFAEYVVYLATAGDAITGDLKVDLTAVAGVAEAIAPAYTIAFWVVYEGATEGSYADPDWTTPDKTVNYETKTDVVLADVTVPSTYGKGLDDKVGTKIIMRVYVDGALVKNDALTVKVPDIKYNFDEENTYAYTTWGALRTALNYDSTVDVIYADGVVMTAEQIALKADTDPITAEDKISWVDNGAEKDATVVEYYVNNATVPSGSTTFEVDFSVVDRATN